MTSKNYKDRVQKLLRDIQSEEDFRLNETIAKLTKGRTSKSEAAYIARSQLEWRRSAQNYELPPGDSSAEHFEVIGNKIVKDPDGSVASAFATAGLDPRNPGHWYDLLHAFTEIHLKRKNRSKRITKEFLDKLKARAESIRARHPKIKKAGLVEKIQEPPCHDYRYIGESRLGKLLTQSGFKYFEQPTKRHRRKAVI